VALPADGMLRNSALPVFAAQNKILSQEFGRLMRRFDAAAWRYSPQSFAPRCE
jgi:hypothetical protein